MKKRLSFILFFLSLLFSFFVQAQNKFELRAGAGDFSDAYFADEGSDFIFGFFVPHHDFSISESGIYSIEGLLSLKNPRFQISASASYESLTTTENNNNITTTYNEHIYAFLPGIYYNYFIKGQTSCYSGVAIGIKALNFSGTIDQSNEINLSYQITPFGARFGKKIGGFAEFGFGSKGLIRAGLSVKF